ncbi:Serine/threonine-protein kinase STY46 [Porphyridium purpureum]|uniref:Serine/threonine-protein kinase STY46 n=1 Tax=Porphyridium purpureum TaxID=35688 RepID=A0A5J4Z0U2_PORPP|nr:Serine/threonine-protein kinase STY46 [Porphyridium purpureum]|eukprot:POR8720..scf208_2
MGVQVGMDQFAGLTERYEKEGWLIKESELTFGKVLGRGASGITYNGEYKGKKVAIKAYSVAILRNDADAVKNEMSLMATLRHPNIVGFCGLCLSREPLAAALVTDYASNGELGDALYVKNLFKKRGAEMRFDVAIGLAEGLKYLAENNIVHRDIKPANVLLGDDFSPLLTDFGFSRLADSSGNMTGETGSYKYMAPEVTKHTKYSVKADVYSYAILINEIFCEERPFESLLPIQAAVAVVKKGQRPSQKKLGDEELKKLIQECWQDDPDRRPQWSLIIDTLKQRKAVALEKGDGKAKNKNIMSKLGF